MADFVGTGMIALFYGHVASNIGDLAINRGEVELLRHAFPRATIRVVLYSARKSAYLASSKASFGSYESLEFVHFRADDKLAPSYVLEPGQILDDCGATDADLIVLAAGEHLFHYADHQNLKNLFWRTLPAFAARQRGRPCLVMPSTFGPFEGAEGMGLMRTLFATGARIATRDAKSAVLLAETLPLGAVKTALDPAFFLPPPDLAGITSKTNPRERVIGLVMRSERWGLRLSKTERDNTSLSESHDHGDSLALRFGVCLANKALASDLRLRIFVQTDADRALSQAIVAQYAGTPDADRIEIVAPRSVEDYLDELAAVDGVVASRFHALVLALVAARPSFGIYFDVHGHKIPGLFDLLGQPNLCIDLSRTGPQAAAEMAISGLEATSLHSRLQRRLDTLRQDTLHWLSADWKTEATENIGGKNLADRQPLGAIAISLMRDAAEKIRVQGKRLHEMEVQMEGFHGKVAELKAELRAEQEKLRTLEGQLSESRETAADGQKRLRAAEAEMARLGHEVRTVREVLAARERNLSVMRSELRRERRRAIEAASDRDTFVKRVEMLEQSESFRIGYAIVKTVTAPVRFLRTVVGGGSKKPATPAKVSKAGEKRKPRAETAPASVLTPDEVARMYVAGGADAIIAGVCDRIDGRTPALGRALIEVSRQAAHSGIMEAEYPLVQKAVSLHRSDQTLRAMFWAAQRAGKIREAWNYLNEIEDMYGIDPNPTKSRWLEKARAGPIMNVGLLDEIVAAPSTPFTTRKNHICYVLHNSLPYSSGGYATRAHGLARGLRAVGIEATCVTRPGYPFDLKPDLKGTTLPQEDVIDNISYVRIWEPVRGGSALSRYVRGAADAMEEQFRKLRPELVMAASAHLSALPALIAARRLALPFIYEVRGFWEITRLSREPEFAERPYFHVQRLMEAEIANGADRVFTLTVPMRDELVERGVSSEKISLLPNSCDPDRFTPRPRSAELGNRLGIPVDVPVIGYIGTFVQYEGLEDLATACALLRARGKVFRLMLVGNEDTSNSGRGSITAEIERVATEGGLSDWLIMPGRVPHEEVEAYYSLIDIAPFPRKPQPVTEMVSPMKPLEALSMEKAVVVSSVRALAELVTDGETGLIFEKGNIESMADTLARLIDDPELRDRLGRTARSWVARERTWITTATKARNEIEQVVSTLRVREQRADPGTAVTLEQPSPKLHVPQHDSRETIFTAVQKLYRARDRARGKVRFPPDDWERTRVAFEMLEGARTVVDIGIGQAQLVNLLVRCADVHKVYGFDFRDYTTRIDPPANGRYSFRVWDITRTLDDAPEPVDAVVAMEVLEHIDVPVVPAVFERLRAMSSQGAVLITVPYREEEPLYHHGQRHGHKQSFDDAKIEELFGPGCLYSNYKQKWYFVFVHDSLTKAEGLDLLDLCEQVKRLLGHIETDFDVSHAGRPAIG